MDGFRVRLSALQAEVLSVLLMRYPGIVAYGDLIEACWPFSEPDYAKPRLHEVVRELRVKLGGFHIKARRSFGYHLVHKRTRHDQE